MALLDIQAMARDDADTRGGCGGSELSVALCDSTVSLTLCL